MKFYTMLASHTHREQGASKPLEKAPFVRISVWTEVLMVTPHGTQPVGGELGRCLPVSRLFRGLPSERCCFSVESCAVGRALAFSYCLVG